MSSELEEYISAQDKLFNIFGDDSDIKMLDLDRFPQINEQND